MNSGGQVKENKLSDEEFGWLTTFDEHFNYFQNLSSTDLIEEVSRSFKLKVEVGSQFWCFMALQRELTDRACQDHHISDDIRSHMIIVQGDIVEILERYILPKVRSDFRQNAEKAIAGQLEYLRRFAAYPRAYEMLLIRARRPTGPYELGVAGAILQRDCDP